MFNIYKQGRPKAIYEIKYVNDLLLQEYKHITHEV